MKTVVSYRNSTSNHNNKRTVHVDEDVVSYRNSTSNHNYRGRKRVIIALYLIEILHQTTTLRLPVFPRFCCILSKFYIKPQLEVVHRLKPCVVSYRNSTSNHNHSPARPMASAVVSYRNSTSNHNVTPFARLAFRLYLIEILHQTTTPVFVLVRKQPLYLIEILHQTTTSGLILIDKVLLTSCLPL